MASPHQAKSKFKMLVRCLRSTVSFTTSPGTTSWTWTRAGTRVRFFSKSTTLISAPKRRSLSSALAILKPCLDGPVAQRRLREVEVTCHSTYRLAAVLDHLDGNLGLQGSGWREILYLVWIDLNEIPGSTRPWLISRLASKPLSRTTTSTGISSQRPARPRRSGARSSIATRTAFSQSRTSGLHGYPMPVNRERSRY